MNKKYILYIIIVLAVICLTSFISIKAVSAEKKQLLKQMDDNNTVISQITDAQNKLHEAANAMRLLQNDNSDFINSLSLKWLELNDVKTKLIQDNASYQQRIDEIIEEENKRKYIGEFTLVAYYQGNITATGTTPKLNHTIAVDPKVIPYGSKVYIEGYGTYVAEDTGVKGNMIDIYMSSYNECIQFGRRSAKVYIVE